MPKTVILSTARTPFAKMGGALARSMRPTSAGADRAALGAPASMPNRSRASPTVQVLQAGQGQIPSRQAQIKAGIPKEVASETVNKVCASGMRSVGCSTRRSGPATSASRVGGGMESMSNAPACCRCPLRFPHG